jgi:hypothetical protein
MGSCGWDNSFCWNFDRTWGWPAVLLYIETAPSRWSRKTLLDRGFEHCGSIWRVCTLCFGGRSTDPLPCLFIFRWMTFCPEWLTGSPNLNTSNALHLWVYLVVCPANSLPSLVLTNVIPSYFLLQCMNSMSAKPPLCIECLLIENDADGPLFRFGWCTTHTVISLAPSARHRQWQGRKVIKDFYNHAYSPLCRFVM